MLENALSKVSITIAQPTLPKRNGSDMRTSEISTLLTPKEAKKIAELFKVADLVASTVESCVLDNVDMSIYRVETLTQLIRKAQLTSSGCLRAPVTCSPNTKTPRIYLLDGCT